nr:reverse transcriptase domain-containing protein [Tanacetum cinerariifolium]
MIKSSNEETLFSLTYGSEAVISAEIGMPTLRTAKVDMVKNNEALGISLDLLEEKREQAVIQEAMNKAKMEGYYNARPHANQLMVPIHHSPDQSVIGAFALSLSLDVSYSQVRKIRENIASHVSALHCIFVPLSDPLSAVALEGTKGTSGFAHDTTTTLSVTFVSTGTISPISIDDYEVRACLRLPHGLVLAPVDKVSWTEAGALNSGIRSKLMPKASLFLTMSTFVVLKVGMPISAEITASDPYVNENSVSSLLDLIMVRCAHKTYYFSWKTESAYDIIPYELFNLSSCYGCHWPFFYPFGEVNSTPSRFMIIKPDLETSMHDDPSVNNIHGSGNSSLSSIGVSGASSSRSSTMKSARIHPFTDVLGRSIFLTGYKVDADGLRVSPDKVKAVLDLPSPKCLKDVQKLNGMLASLNSDFQWTPKAKGAFIEIKQSIAELPMLTTPKEKEELIMYLAAAKEAISAILMTERDGKQVPVYFDSHALQGPKINYTLMEKPILAL